MTLHRLRLYGTLVCLLHFAPGNLSAQCNGPSSLWLHSAQSSTSLPLNWTQVAGITQYQIRYWENALPNDKTIVEQPGAAPFVLTGLKKSTAYSLQIRSACSNNTFSAWNTQIGYLTSGAVASCSTPTGVTATANSTAITVNWTSGSDHTVRYRPGNSGDWIIPSGGLSVSTPPFIINGLASGTYQVQVKRNCTGTGSNYAGTTVVLQVVPPPPTSCLTNKDYGKNLSAADLIQINSDFNTASPFTFGEMIGVNDGGLVFRSFLNEQVNPITRLTTRYRNFHTIDEDFDASIGLYAQNVKPRNTQPEGTPANTAHNKNYYNLYRNTHGFTNITGAIELLHYGPQSWKDKIYLESDWSSFGASGIRQSFENYTKKFIDVFAPANGTVSQLLVTNFQVGNELWDYPVKSDYHSLLTGAHNAFVSKYGQKSAGGWKMSLVAGAFQAFRDNNCASTARDVSNCGGSLERHDFIGDYLNVTDCSILRDLDAIDCHPYSFLPGSTTWTYPENPSSEAWQIRNLAAWLNANKNAGNGMLNNTRLWSSEYGFDSNPATGVGELTQSAYLIRGLFMHSRFHFERVYFYNAFDQARTTDNAYSGLYYSSGFWKLGTQPANSAWPSPLQQHGATPKPSWYAMLDLKTRFGNHVFYKALSEDAEASVWLIARPDGSEPYLVFWAPQQTSDANVNSEISVSKPIDWSGVLAGNFSIETGTGQTFAGDENPGQTFSAASGSACGSTTIHTIRRNPAFIRLMTCSSCSNVTNAGGIIDPNPSSGANPFNPGPIISDFAASGGTDGSIGYQWQESQFNTNFTDIPGATELAYDPPALNHSKYFRRGARRSNCPDFLYSPSVLISVTSACPNIASFRRYLNTNNGCNGAADYYYEVILNNVTAVDQITLSGLPTNGLAIPASSLNGVNFNTQTFFSNLQYLGSSSFNWLVSPANGSTQTLRIYYCWSNTYPNPVGTSTATSLCSALSKPCSVAPAFTESNERESEVSELNSSGFDFTVQPNPGTDHIVLNYSGIKTAGAKLRIFNGTGQLVASPNLPEVENGSTLSIPCTDLPPGLYYLCMQIGGEMKYRVWGKL
ncbi:MAG TPA: fibronectin type III domain-containing protein [Saprospiraceae bacterium]|nr:fibronectin type III domain-containing protein [Saprospiraceae bacterium]HPI08658.1 fibronectin type III domain-containing protein [Saprospiraceae bacterium]